MDSEKLASNNTVPLGQTNLRKITPVKIKIGKDTEVTTSLEELKEALKKDFYKKSGIGISIE